MSIDLLIKQGYDEIDNSENVQKRHPFHLNLKEGALPYMIAQSLYLLKECPSCHSSKNQIDWLTWCSKCGKIVCSHCVHTTHICKDGYHFGIPGRGTRYFATANTRD